jgi:hypothetical protein
MQGFLGKHVANGTSVKYKHKWDHKIKYISKKHGKYGLDAFD